MKRQGSICLLPKIRSLGGPASFQSRLIMELKALGMDVHHNPSDPTCSVILVSGGTRQLVELWKARRRGVRIVQRLAQGNWIHWAQFTGVGHFYRSVRNNLLLAAIRRYMTDRIVYQSQFVEQFWKDRFGSVFAGEFVIHNGVDLQKYSPDGPHNRPDDHIRILVVEGHFGEGNRPFLENAIRLAQALDKKITKKVELMIVGDVPDSLCTFWTQKTDLWITWAGVVDRDQIPEIDRSAHLLFSAELNAGCPNAVVEALACGLPVIGYETGALPELVENVSGIVVPYGGDYWKLESPDISSMVNAAVSVIDNQNQFRLAARARAEAALDVNLMVEKYLNVLYGD